MSYTIKKNTFENSFKGKKGNNNTLKYILST